MKMSLKKARLINELTQKQMAEKLGVCRDTYVQMEKNPCKVTVDQAKKISCITGVSYNDIFF